MTSVTVKVSMVDSGEMELSVDGDSYRFRLDGQQRPGLWGHTAAWTELGPFRWQTVHRLNDRVIGTEVSKLSADQNTLTQTMIGTKPSGESFKDVMVLRRAAGDRGLEGTWKGAALSSSLPEVLQFESDGDDGLRYTLPGWQTVATAKLDGKDYPMSGPGIPAGTAWSISRTGPRTFLRSLKRPGSADWVGTLTVSEDDKTLIEVGGPKGAQPSKWVYDRR
jgi:hypothetical protein